jgi:hypothetical protein
MDGSLLNAESSDLVIAKSADHKKIITRRTGAAIEPTSSVPSVPPKPKHREHGEEEALAVHQRPMKGYSGTTTCGKVAKIRENRSSPKTSRASLDSPGHLW